MPGQWLLRCWDAGTMITALLRCRDHDYCADEMPGAWLLRCWDARTMISALLRCGDHDYCAVEMPGPWLLRCWDAGTRIAWLVQCRNYRITAAITNPLQIWSFECTAPQALIEPAVALREWNFITRQLECFVLAKFFQRSVCLNCGLRTVFEIAFSRRNCFNNLIILGDFGAHANRKNLELTKN